MKASGIRINVASWDDCAPESTFHDGSIPTSKYKYILQDGLWSGPVSLQGQPGLTVPCARDWSLSINMWSYRHGRGASYYRSQSSKQYMKPGQSWTMGAPKLSHSNRQQRDAVVDFCSSIATHTSVCQISLVYMNNHACTSASSSTARGLMPPAVLSLNLVWASLPKVNLGIL